MCPQPPSPRLAESTQLWRPGGNAVALTVLLSNTNDVFPSGDNPVVAAHQVARPEDCLMCWPKIGNRYGLKYRHPSPEGRRRL